VLLDPGGKSALSQPLDLSAKQRDPAEVSSPFLLGDTADTGIDNSGANAALLFMVKPSQS
jgi:hypothetical protein